MKPETEEWIKKAEGDWATMLREHKVTDNPNYDAVCFHAHNVLKNISKHVCLMPMCHSKKLTTCSIYLMIFQKLKVLGRIWRRL